MRKSQTALEYMMTYGWAILIVIIVAGALYALGLTKPCKWLPTRVTELADFRIERAKFTTSYLSFELSYSKPNTVKLHDVNISGDASSSTNPFGGTIITSNPILIAEATNTSKTENECYNLEVSIKYNITTSRGEETFTALGKIAGTVEKHTDPENVYICTNAQDAGLCGGLDIVYGSGYRAACCSNYGLCCS